MQYSCCANSVSEKVHNYVSTGIHASQAELQECDSYHVNCCVDCILSKAKEGVSCFSHHGDEDMDLKDIILQPQYLIILMLLCAYLKTVTLFVHFPLD